MPISFHSLALIVALILPVSAAAIADELTIEQGHALVDLYCSGCHATGPDGDSPLAIAPRFRDLHERYDVEFLGEALVEGIVTAHESMPAFAFDPQQAGAIIDYLKSLEPGTD